MLKGENFDENSSSSITRLLTELEKITLKTDASLFCTHHFRKGNMGKESHIDRGAGSGVFARMVDCIISLSPHQLAEHAIFEMTSRSQKAPKPFVLKMTPPLISVAENADPTAYKRYGTGCSEEITDESILDIIPTGQALSKQDWFSKARMQGVAEGNFNTHFNSLRSGGHVKVLNVDGVTAYRKTVE